MQPNTAIAPFGRPFAELPVLNVPVATWREKVLNENGLVREGSGYRRADGLVVQWDDDVFVSPEFMTAFLSGAGRAGRSVVAEVGLGTLHLAYGPNRTAFPEVGTTRLRYGLRATPHGADAEAPPQSLELPWSNVHAKLAQPGRMDPLVFPLETAFIWSAQHWCDVLSCNQMALAAATSRMPAGVERAENVEIHPTATVERSRLGKGVRIGPYSLVTGSTLGDGVVVGNHAAVNGSVIGPGSLVQEQCSVKDSVVGPDVVVSFRTSVRASVLMGSSTSSVPALPRCIVGEQTFLARGLAIAASVLDGSTIWVWHRGKRVDTGIPMLGVAIGPGARAGGVSLPAGYEVPSSYYLAGRPVGRLSPDLPRGETLVETNGSFRSFGRYVPTPKGDGTKS